MKKAALLLVSILTVLSAACGSRPDVAPGTIAPSEFSEETREVLSILDDEIAFFDYEVPETIRSYMAEIWIYRDGGWSLAGNTNGNVESGRHRMAVRISDSAYDIFSMDDSGHERASFPASVEFPAADAVVSSRLTQPAAIEPGRDIPLWVRLSTDKAQIPVDFTDDYRAADCTAGVSVVIRFFEEAAD